MPKTLMVMAGGTGGHVFGSGVTFAALTLACTENMSRLPGGGHPYV